MKNKQPKKFYSQGQDIFFKSIEMDKIADVELMLKGNPALISAEDDYKCQPLFFVKSKEMAELLVNNGADVNARNHHGRSIVHCMARYSYGKDILEFLLSCGADVNARDYGNSTPLYDAVDMGVLEMVELLLSKGADPNIIDKTGFSVLVDALDELSDEEGLPIARILVHYGACVENIAIAAHLGNLPLLKSFIRKDPSLVNFQNLSRETALHYAVWYKHWDIIELLLQSGADINIQDYRMQTVLHCAADAGDVEIVKFLIGKGADTKIKDRDNKTALELE